MALTNRQYSDIEREYESRRMRHIRQMQAKLDEAYIKFPRLSQIDEEYTALSMKKARARLGLGAAPDPSDEAKLEELSFERKVLLKRAGFEDGIISPEYDCPYCKDTGFVDGKKCSCFLKAERLMLSEKSGLESILEKENFSTFSLGVYSDSITDPDTGESARAAARYAYKAARAFADNFENEYKNIYFYGKTGVGKTFLSHCIAKSLIDKGVNVLFLSERDMLAAFEDDHFRTTDESRAEAELIMNCDLLIIDDFGSAQNTNFVSSALLGCIEGRHLARKSTIITTNLSLEDLRNRYSDRIFSRIYSYYEFIYLFGEDIRINTKQP